MNFENILQTLIADSSEGETLFGGLFETQGAEPEIPAPPESNSSSWKNEGKLAIAESVSYIKISGLKASTMTSSR